MIYNYVPVDDLIPGKIQYHKVFVDSCQTPYMQSILGFVLGGGGGPKKISYTYTRKAKTLVL